MTRRRAIRLSLLTVLCLLLGAATTVGVAWGRDWEANVGPMSPANTAGAGPLRADGSRGMFRNEATGAAWDVASLPDGTLRSITDRGWPLLALSSEVLVDKRGAAFGSPVQAPLAWRWVSWAEGFVALPGYSDLNNRLPVMPLFPGFAVDTALYAMAWYLLLFTPLPLYRAGRRRFRVSRGMCGWCGYDLKGSPDGACPECGRALVAKP